VGVTEFTDFPPALKKVASVGRYDRVSLEAVVALKPDLVLATTDGNARDQIERLRELRIAVLVVDAPDFAGAARSMREVGAALGLAERGDRLARRFEIGIERLRERGMAVARKPRVLLQVGSSPLVVAGGGSFLSEGLKTIGAENVVGSAAGPYLRPSLETVIQADPEQIIVLAMTPDDPAAVSAVREWRRHPGLSAVASGKVRVFHSDALLRPSVRLLEGLSLLERLVHGPGRGTLGGGDAAGG
jgi:iron complex transport system substrate-binding protein